MESSKRRGFNRGVPETSVASCHPIWKNEDVLESLFGYFDTESLKKCRLVCRDWNPVATKLLVRVTFCGLESRPLGKMRNSVKLDFALIGPIAEHLSSKCFCLAVPWRSVFVSHVQASEIADLKRFIKVTGQCPELSQLKVNFAAEYREVFVEGFSSRFLGRGRNSKPVVRANRKQVERLETPLRVSKITRLHLTFDGFTNVSNVSKFLGGFLKKMGVDLKELWIEYGDGIELGREDAVVVLAYPYKEIVKTLRKSSGALRNVRSLRLQGRIGFGGSVEEVNRNLMIRKSEIPHSAFEWKLSGELKELQVGSFVVGPVEGNEAPGFLPGILNPSVAVSLVSLDLSGLYIPKRRRKNIVKFPELPNLRKLTAEELAIVWIKNFPDIFKAAEGIKKFGVKNSWIHKTAREFRKLEEVFKLEVWEETVKEYSALCVLDLGDSLNVRHVESLRSIGRIFPNVEVFSCIVDDWGRRKNCEETEASCEIDVLSLSEIVEGLKGWKSLKQFKLIYWPLYSIKELVKHLVDVSIQLVNLRLYDFYKSDSAIASMHVEELSSSTFLQDLEMNLLLLKKSPLVVLLHGFHCQQIYEESVDGNTKQLHGCYIIQQIIGCARKLGINVRHGGNLVV